MENEIKAIIEKHVVIQCNVVGEDVDLDQIHFELKNTDTAAEAIVGLIARQSSISASAGDIASELKAAMRLRRSYIFARGQNTGVIAPPTHRYLRRHTGDVYIHWKNLEIDIQNLLDSQPIDKVRAMAALVGYNDYRSSEYTSAYNVPGENGEMFMVRFFSHKGERWVYCRNAKSYEICCSTNRSCEHIQAVECHLATAQEVRG